MKYKKIDFENVGKKIKFERVMRGFSREKLGAMIGTTGATIKNMEENAEKSLFRNVVYVAKALNVSLEEILY